MQRLKHLPAMQETWVRSLGWEDPLEKEMATPPIFLPGKSHGQRSLVGYSPWGSKESDTTEWLHFKDQTYSHNLHFKITGLDLNNQSVSRSVVPNSLQPHGLQPTRSLCPWDFPGKDTGVGCHFLLQGIFSTQGSNPGLLHCRQILYRLSYKGSPDIS